ncbi:MAG TPA: cytochrome C oxidase subunit IV family protein [Terriglobales bacterium]|nr:cytochrome C oxidase subunit IV family protein [Terriglobales bacterium]
MTEHVLPKKTYIIVWVALMCLTVATAAVSKVELGPFNAVVALAIATMKGLLVVLFFMGVKYISQKMTIVAIVAGLFWLGILLSLSMADYGTRAFR